MNLILLDHPPPSPQDEGSSSAAADVPRGDFEFSLAATDARAKHVAKHLKKSAGDRLRVGLVPHGPLGEAILQSPSPTGGVRLRVDGTTLRPPPNRPLVRVLLGVPYPKVIKALWPVLTSMGVDRIAYVKAALTEPGFLETSSLTPPVYQTLLREGLAQGEDTRPPTVTVFPKNVSLLDVLSSSSSSQPRQSSSSTSLEALTRDCCKIVLHIGQGVPSAGSSIRQCYRRQLASPSPAKGILLAIGPERGWTDAEAKAFERADFDFASLGDPILRTDTAVVAAVALARDVLSEGGSWTP